MIQTSAEPATEVTETAIEMQDIALETDSETHKVTDVKTDSFSPLQGLAPLNSIPFTNLIKSNGNNSPPDAAEEQDVAGGERRGGGGGGKGGGGCGFEDYLQLFIFLEMQATRKCLLNKFGTIFSKS